MTALFIGVYGASGFGKEVMPLVRQQYPALAKEQFVFIDEFDSFYHHELSAAVVEQLKKIKSQVILTTHNVSVMSNEILRPDCYFVMSKTEVSPLYLKTSKELREAHNLGKMYKAGSFND